MMQVRECLCGRYTVGQRYQPIGTGETFYVQAIENTNSMSKVYADAGFLIHYCGEKPRVGSVRSEPL